MYVPTILEGSKYGDRAWDLFSRLLRDRIIFLGCAIDDAVANIVVGELLFLEAEKPGEEISLYINSPGGSCTAGLAILDCMDSITSPISTYCIGRAASMGAVLFCSGAKGKRFILPNAKTLVHQPLGGAEGQASDIEIQAREILKIKKTLLSIIAKQTGQTYEKVEKDADRDYWLDAQESIGYGLADSIYQKKTVEEK